MSFFCYLLYSGSAKTYIGATVDPNRRLRQHNGELVGGARRTSGLQWKRALYVGGFPDWTAALQFEWSWKRHGRGKHGLFGKIRALLALLDTPRSTKTALPFALWSAPPWFSIEEAIRPMLEKIEGGDRLLSVCGARASVLSSSVLPFNLLTNVLPSNLLTSEMSSAATSSASSAKVITKVKTTKTVAATAAATAATAATGGAGSASVATKASPAATKASPAAATAAPAPATAATAAIQGPTLESVAHNIELMMLQITELNGKLDATIGLLSASASATASGAKAPKAKGAKAEKAEKVVKAPKEKAAKEPKEKKACPPAAEGVVRFSSSAGTAPNRIFSPLFKQSFTVGDKEFQTVEHYAQYIKFATTDPEFAVSLLEKAPATLRMAGGGKKHEADPEYNIEAAYRAAYTAAMAENEDLKTALLATGDAPIEAEYPSDAVLGIGEDGAGQNLLGAILMALRTTARA